MRKIAVVLNKNQVGIHFSRTSAIVCNGVDNTKEIIYRYTCNKLFTYYVHKDKFRVFT